MDSRVKRMVKEYLDGSSLASIPQHLQLQHVDFNPDAIHTNHVLPVADGVVASLDYMYIQPMHQVALLGIVSLCYGLGWTI